MKYISKYLDCKYILQPSWGMGSHPLFLDIETTGLSAGRAMIYLIGTARPEGDKLHFMQWLAEGPFDEKAVIEAAFSVITPETTVITFNGETFDLPFIERRAKRFRLPYAFDYSKSFDLLKKLRPLKKLLGLPRCSQKSFEAFLGMPREDKEDGGALIRVYWDYVRNHSEQLAHLFLIHNEEDVLNMAGVSTLLSYRSLQYGDLSAAELIETECTDGALNAALRVSENVPVQLDFSRSTLRGRIRDDLLTLSIPLADTSLYYFFKDYKDYYYIPEQDTAVHKSVGEFIPKEQRVQAKKETARVKKNGLFIPCAGIARTGLHLYREAPGAQTYLSLSEICADDLGFWNTFISEDLPMILAGD